MNTYLLFAEVLEAVDQLSLEERETLLEIVHRRIGERGVSGWLPRFGKHGKSSPKVYASY